MKAEVRQRIEQIRQGKVPAGYQKTKHGIFPKEWEIGPVGDLIQEYKSFSNDIESMPVYSSSRNGLIRQAEYYDRKESQKTNLGYKVVPPEYVTYRHMSDDDIFHFNINTTGESILVSAEYPVFRSNGHSDLNFLIPLLNNSPQFRYFCRTQKLGGTRTRLYFRVLETYEIVAPCLEEQQEIAKILMTQDRVIALREKLLAEKLRQKQYLMQVLLTGKKRLPGFNGRWSHIKIGDSRYTKINYDSLSNKTEENFQFKYITLENVDNGKLKQTIHCTYKNAPSRARRVVHKEDILYGLVRPNLHSHLLANEMMEGMVCSTGFCVIRCNTTLLLPYFLFSVIMSEMIDRQANQIMTGSNYPAVSSVDVENMEIDIPCDIKEQQAVIAILSNADQEIDLLRQALEQERQKKKALMQLLLSGIVRVKP